jgi:hypothetical protein
MIFLSFKFFIKSAYFNFLSNSKLFDSRLDEILEFDFFQYISLFEKRLLMIS